MDFWQSLFPKANSPNDWQEWLQKYMNESFTSSSTQATSSSPSSQPNQPYTLFESFHFVYIHLSINEVSLSDIHVHHTLSHLIIRIQGKSELKIPLPTPVSKKGATAEVKGDTLEICLPKSRQQFEMELSIDSID